MKVSTEPFLCKQSWKHRLIEKCNYIKTMGKRPGFCWFTFSVTIKANYSFRKFSQKNLIFPYSIELVRLAGVILFQFGSIHKQSHYCPLLVQVKPSLLVTFGWPLSNPITFCHFLATPPPWNFSSFSYQNDQFSPNKRKIVVISVVDPPNISCVLDWPLLP